MSLKQRIIEAVKIQATANARMRQLEADMQKCNNTLQKVDGRLELINELVQEEYGKDINQFVKDDAELNEALRKAAEDGVNIAIGETTEPVEPARSPVVSDRSPVPNDAPPAQATQTTNHTSNPDRQSRVPQIAIVDEPPLPEPEAGDTAPRKVD